MSPTVIQLIVFGFLASSANILGGLILFPSKLHHNYRQLLRYLVALGAGFMLAVTLYEILPKSIDLWRTSGNMDLGQMQIPMLLILFGYLLTQFFEHTIAPHFHLGEDVHAGEMITASSAYTGIGGFLMHTFFDGVSIAAALYIDHRTGLLVFLAVFLHKIPEGFTIGSMVLAAGKGFREVLIATSVVGFATLLGVFVFFLIGSNVNSSIMYALPIAGGVTLYVAASDLIPEVNHHGGKSPLISLSVFAGVGLFFLSHFLLHLFVAD